MYSTTIKEILKRTSICLPENMIEILERKFPMITESNIDAALDTYTHLYLGQTTNLPRLSLETSKQEVKEDGLIWIAREFITKEGMEYYMANSFRHNVIHGCKAKTRLFTCYNVNVEAMKYCLEHYFKE